VADAPISATLGAAITSYANGTYLSIAGPICTATPSYVGAYYAESPDRATGLRVETSDTMNVGEQVTVVGHIMTKPTGERYLAAAKVTSRAAATAIKPVSMRGTSAGGSALGSYCAGIPGTFGPYNVGTLVRVFGRVKAVTTSHMYVNDGSLAGDGVKIVTTGLSGLPPVGRYVRVTGIVQLEGTAGSATVLLDPRTSADVQSCW